MGKQDLIEVGLVIMGLLFLVWTVIAIPAVFIMYAMKSTEYVPDPAVWAKFGLVEPVVYGILGLLFLSVPNKLSNLLARRLSNDDAGSG